MIASVCLEQKLIQPSLQKTSKDIWGFTCQTPFISEFLLQRRGWDICKHPCSAPSTFLSPPAGSRSSLIPCGPGVGKRFGCFCPRKGMLSREYVAMLSGFQDSSLPSWWLCSGGWGWHSVLSPFPREGLGELGGGLSLGPVLPWLALGGGFMSWALLPLPLLVFTFLIWCVCLAPPWLAHGKLLQFGNPGQGEISFLESCSWPLFLPPPQCAAGSVPALPLPAPALPSWPPALLCSASLFTLQLDALQVPPPHKLLRGGFPAYLFSLCKVHRLEREWALLKQNQAGHPQQLCKARLLLTPREKCVHCFLS